MTFICSPQAANSRSNTFCAAIEPFPHIKNVVRTLGNCRPKQHQFRGWSTRLLTRKPPTLWRLDMRYRL